MDNAEICAAFHFLPIHIEKLVDSSLFIGIFQRAQYRHRADFHFIVFGEELDFRLTVLRGFIVDVLSESYEDRGFGRLQEGH